MAHGNSFRNHLIKLDVHRVRVGTRYWRFTFSDSWGPLLTDEWGEPIDNTPLADEQHPFWDKFEAWQAEHSPIGASPAIGSSHRLDEPLLSKGGGESSSREPSPSIRGVVRREAKP